MSTSFLESHTEIDETLEPKKVNVVGTIWGIIVMGILATGYWFVWGFGELSNQFFIKVGISVILFIILHELLHVIGYMVFGKVTRKQIKLGIIWSQLMPYAHCKVPIKLKAYQAAVLLPLFVLGILPTIYAFVVGSGYWATIGIFMIVSAIGDVLIYRVIRKHSDEDYVLDHPEKIGCIVYKQKGE